MPSVKIVFREEKRYLDGTSPVMLRIIASRKVAERQLCKIRPEDWNPATQRVRRGHPQANKLNTLIGARFQAAEKLMLTQQALERPVVAEEIAQAVMSNQTDSYTGHFRAYIQSRRDQGQGATADQYDVYLNGLLEFTGGQEVSFGELSDKFLQRFIKHSREKSRQGTTIYNYLNVFRIVWLDALKRKLTTGNPFDFVSVKKNEVRKQKLNAEEIDKLEALEISSATTRFHARNFFLLQFYLRGVRISELAALRRDQVITDPTGLPVIIEFVAPKTGRVMAVKLHPKAQRLVAHYLTHGKGLYLMPFFKWKRDPKLSHDENAKTFRQEHKRVRDRINNNLRQIEKSMKLGKKLRSHVSRHSFANQADKKGVDRRAIARMLGQRSQKTLEIYLAELRDDELDEAAAEVFG